MAVAAGPLPYVWQRLPDALALPENGRGLCVGRTQTGKTTLEARLIADYVLRYGADTLIVDSKPRFMAERMQAFGMKWPSRRLSPYKSWAARVQPFPHSERVNLEQPNLRGIFRRRHVAIVSPENRSQWGAMWGVVRTFYGRHAKRRRLLVIDEAAQVYEQDRAGASVITDSVARGAERDLAVAGTAQRPRWIPVSLLTELSVLYLFELTYSKDVDHLAEAGVPASLLEKLAPTRTAYDAASGEATVIEKSREEMGDPHRFYRWDFGTRQATGPYILR